METIRSRIVSAGAQTTRKLGQFKPQHSDSGGFLVTGGQQLAIQCLATQQLAESCFGGQARDKEGDPPIWPTYCNDYGSSAQQNTRSC